MFYFRKTAWLNNPGVAIFLAALILRVAAALIAGPGGGDDDGYYVGVAKDVLAGQGLIFDRETAGLRSWLPPAFAYVLAASFKIFGVTLEPLRWIFIIFGALSCVVLYAIGRELFGCERGAQLAGWVSALYPAQIFWSSRVTASTPATFLFVVALWLVSLYQKQKKPVFLALTGLCLALLSLTRGEYFLCVGAILIYLFILEKKSLKPIAIFLAFLALGLAPWVIRNWKIHHKFILLATNYADNFVFAFNPRYHFTGHALYPPGALDAIQGKTEVERSKILMGYAFDFIRANPGRALYHWAGNLAHFWRPWLSADAVSFSQNFIYTIGWLPVFVLCLWGFKSIPWRSQPYWVLLGLIVLFKWGGHSFFYVIVRFREAIMPALILFACHGALLIRKIGDRSYAERVQKTL